MDALTLYTFPPSLDSEFSRFLLHHYGVTAREERHVIVFQSVVTLVRAGTPRIPTLQGGDEHRLDTVTKIFNYLEARAAPDRKLLTGVDPTRMAADWNDFHKVMQTASTVFPYYHLVPRRDLMVRALSEGSPAFEVEAVTAVLSGLRAPTPGPAAAHAQAGGPGPRHDPRPPRRDRQADRRWPPVHQRGPVHPHRHVIRDRRGASGLARQLRRPAPTARRHPRAPAGTGRRGPAAPVRAVRAADLSRPPRHALDRLPIRSRLTLAAEPDGRHCPMSHRSVPTRRTSCDGSNHGVDYR